MNENIREWPTEGEEIPSQARSLRDADFGSLWAAYPRMGRSELVKKLGGDVADVMRSTESDSSDSAIRLSLAFNDAQFPMPPGSSSRYTGKEVTDASGRRYATDALALKEILTKRQGKPRHLAGEEKAMRRAGILLFEGPGGAAHIDLWDGEECADVKGERWGAGVQVWYWELPHSSVPRGCERLAEADAHKAGRGTPLRAGGGHL